MRFYKLRITPNARALSKSFNADVSPEAVREVEDRELVALREQLKSKEVLVGEEVSRCTRRMLFVAEAWFRRSFLPPPQNWTTSTSFADQSSTAASTLVITRTAHLSWCSPTSRRCLSMLSSSA
jgi:hypothetical protein